ncbi:MAG: hypothetical protein ACPGYY_08775, partial [Bacteroidia bacterium]
MLFCKRECGCKFRPWFYTSATGLSFIFVQTVYKVISIWSLLTISLIANGQDLTLGIVDNGKISFENVIDSISTEKSLNLRIKNYQQMGYFGVYADSLTQKQDTIWANIQVGQQYKYIVLDSHNIAEGYLPKNTNRTLDLAQFKKLQDDLLYTYEANGYPFAQLVLSENQTKEDTLVSQASFYPGMQVVYDSLIYYG